MSNQSGFASLRLAVPLAAALRRRAVFVQGFAVDAAGAFAGLSFSAGMRLTFGD